MNSYADYLANMTVKALNALAKEMKLRGYSKLRKAELVEIIARQVGMDESAAYKQLPVILDTDSPADHAQIIKIMAEVMPVEFSAAPITKAPESNAEAVNVATPTEDTPEDVSELLYAYRAMRKTLHAARGKTHASIAKRLRNLSMMLKDMGMNMQVV